ncbi:MAG: hypothetical protein A2234_02620 [Elusimicrobia bacterium RIFOXYA2_FULL_58_8]|nr:MAG: hypothetical protein A2285_08275 [Elusimicrobia bacterium RIFOXYA12_FULL_57_11]OGS13103.1 MAG: hypothetical protein A2234_02620 [Elusimicrobia bacterium RIFOXYA2_FULL_58_8]
MLKINNHFFELCVAAGLALCPFTLLNAGIKITPVADISLLGGKYYLDSDAASFQGRFDAFFSPAMKLGENHDLIPIYSGNYSGTQDIQELAGGGVLTRQRQTHTFSLKYVYTDEFNKYKPRISYSKALIKETKDEKWNDGLFDYTTLSVGIDAEQERPHGTFTESYDFYKVAYPNYSTLLSQSQSVFNDTDTFNQLSTNSGTDPMDNTSHRLGFTYAWFPEPLNMKAGYDLTYRSYADQAIAARPVTGQSPFKSDKRADIMQNLSLKANRVLKPLYLSAGVRVGWLSSNQGSYDSVQSEYMEDYYSYVDIAVSPAMNLALKNGAQFGFALDWRRVYYLGRLKQGVTGTYADSEINQTFWLTSITARYPVFNRFFARAAYNYQVSTSNMRYEENYRYNYRASTYLLGLEWEF